MFPNLSEEEEKKLQDKGLTPQKKGEIGMDVYILKNGEVYKLMREVLHDKY